MESNNDENWSKSLVQMMSEFSFFLTIIIGVSSSIELGLRLLTKRLFRKKFVFRYLLLFKAVSDLLVLVSSLASFSLQAFLNRSPFHPLSFYAWLDVYSHQVLVVASTVSELTTFVYSCLSLLELAQQRREDIFAANIVSASTFVVVIGTMELRAIVVPLLQFSPAHYLVLAMKTFMFWVDILALILLCIVCGSVATEEFNKVYGPLDDGCHDNKNKDNENTIAGKNKDRCINIKIADTTEDKKCSTNIANDNNIDGGSNSVNCYKTSDEPCSENTKLLLLLGVSLSCFLFNCILLYRNASSFSSDLEIVYAFYSTATLIAVLIG